MENKSNDVLTQIEDTAKMYSDQTEPFPFPSSQGYRYILVAYDVNSNAILAQLLKSKKSVEMKVVLLGLINRLTKRDFRPNRWVMYNKCAEIIKDMFGEMKITYHFVPEGTDRRNAAEIAVKTFKHHLIAVILGSDPHFPQQLWDTMLPQCKMTLNIL